MRASLLIYSQNFTETQTKICCQAQYVCRGKGSFSLALFLPFPSRDSQPCESQSRELHIASWSTLDFQLNLKINFWAVFSISQAAMNAIRAIRCSELLWKMDWEVLQYTHAGPDYGHRADRARARCAPKNLTWAFWRPLALAPSLLNVRARCKILAPESGPAHMTTCFEATACCTRIHHTYKDMHRDTYSRELIKLQQKAYLHQRAMLQFEKMVRVDASWLEFLPTNEKI
jgi:hypothetical protein